MSFALVTGLFGGYEPLQDLPAGVSGVCFTDWRVSARGWETRTLPASVERKTSSPRLRNRYVKTLVHTLVDADVVLYIDSSFKVVEDPRPWADNVLGDGVFAAYKHPWRDCVYREAEVCIETGRGNPDTLRAQVERYRAAGLPEASGLFGGGVIVRRMVPEVVAFCAAWWDEIECGSERDQLSLAFLVWQRRMSIRAIPGDLYAPPFASFCGHERAWQPLPFIAR